MNIVRDSGNFYRLFINDKQVAFSQNRNKVEKFVKQMKKKGFMHNIPEFFFAVPLNLNLDRSQNV